jgi:hypothetical protein
MRLPPRPAAHHCACLSSSGLVNHEPPLWPSPPPPNPNLPNPNPLLFLTPPNFMPPSRCVRIAPPSAPGLLRLHLCVPFPSCDAPHVCRWLTTAPTRTSLPRPTPCSTGASCRCAWLGGSPHPLALVLAIARALDLCTGRNVNRRRRRRRRRNVSCRPRYCRRAKKK